MAFIVIGLFTVYVFLEATSITPRIAGAFVGANGVGYAFGSMLNTVKRVFIVSYPPVLGWLAISGESLYPAIFISYFFGSVALLLTFALRFVLVTFFARNISAYSDGVSLISLLFGRAKVGRVFDIKPEGLKNNINIKLVVTSSWIYFVYGSSMFVVNILA